MSSIVRALGPLGFGVYDLEWSDAGPYFAPSAGRPDGFVVPGFVDIHIHGAFGIDFMSASKEEMQALCIRLGEEGYEGFLPTTITANRKDLESAIANLPDHEMVLGFHLEGPFISELHPGAQPPEAIASIPTAAEWDSVLRDPRLRVVTLAPEKPGAETLIRQLVELGVAVSMGHSDATFSQGEDGVAAGANHVTHTFNAMRGFHHREAGLTGLALLDDRVYAELIYDRIHVSRPAAKLLVSAKPEDKLVAVSDCSMAAGMPSGRKIMMWGHECVTSPGEVRLASNGALAGSAITLLDAFRNFSEDFGPEVAIRACCINPRLSIGMQIKPRMYLEFSDALELRGIRRIG